MRQHQIARLETADLNPDRQRLLSEQTLQPGPRTQYLAQNLQFFSQCTVAENLPVLAGDARHQAMSKFSLVDPVEELQGCESAPHNDGAARQARADMGIPLFRKPPATRFRGNREIALDATGNFQL